MDLIMLEFGKAQTVGSGERQAPQLRPRSAGGDRWGATDTLVHATHAVLANCGNGATRTHCCRLTCELLLIGYVFVAEGVTPQLLEDLLYQALTR